MVFSSLIFIFAYLAATLAVYFVCPLKWRNAVLFAVSLLFYGWGEPKYIALMLLNIISAYFFGFGIEKYRVDSPKKAKIFLALSLVFNLSFLLFFKYFNFFASAFGAKGIEGLVLPVGISFYTFQIMSYSVDLYRGEVGVAKNLIRFGTYVTLFPQLIAGPIVRYKDICDQLIKRDHGFNKFASGARRFVCGLAKKLILGDAAALAAERFVAQSHFQKTFLGALFIAVFYTFHIYFDFSGYSDMAIGLGKFFGFDFPENFNYPYIAKSVTDFWRRWHITLSTWFREYVYIPLGGNRKGKARTYLNLAAVWVLTGFWHGANWNFLLWGVYYLIFLIIEKAFLLKYLNRSEVFSRIYLLSAVAFGWVIFFGQDLSLIKDTAFSLLFIGAKFTDSAVTHGVLSNLPFIAVCILGCTPIPKKITEKAAEKFKFFEPVRALAMILLFAICTAYMVDNTFSPFLYYIF